MCYTILISQEQRLLMPTFRRAISWPGFYPLIERTFSPVVPLPQLLLTLRRLNGISQRALGRDVGVSDVQILRFERGEATPSAAELRKIAEILGIRADVLARATLGTAS
jgi:DNA-binding XRE family transcriptional regulator